MEIGITGMHPGQAPQIDAGVQTAKAARAARE